MRLGHTLAGVALAAGAGIYLVYRWRRGLNAELEEGGGQQEICRICHDESPVEKLVSPCKCKGTQAYVHLACERQWQIESGNNICRVCGEKVALKHTLGTVRRKQA